MVDFVRRISEYAKSRAGSGFLVIPQNGERLLEHEDYVGAIDGIAKEDLFWGYESDDAPTPEEETDFSIGSLQRALGRGKFVLTVDYPPDAVTVRSMYTASRVQGFVPYAADRDLDGLHVNAELDPASLVLRVRHESLDWRRILPRSRRAPRCSRSYCLRLAGAATMTKATTVRWLPVTSPDQTPT